MNCHLWRSHGHVNAINRNFRVFKNLKTQFLNQPLQLCFTPRYVLKNTAGLGSLVLRRCL